MATTLQSNIKQGGVQVENYSLYLGGLNVKNNALKQYSPLRTGYGRIFFITMPYFMKRIMKEETARFKHMLEYGNVGIDGIQNKSMDFESMTGGFAGRSFDVSGQTRDETNEITIKMYESTGSPIREYTDMWMSGISDANTGYGHYHGAMEEGGTPQNPLYVPYNQANHTAEAIYVSTDPTGRAEGIEYACMLTNMMVKTIKVDHFNTEPGQHPVVQVDVPFTCVKYESPDINLIAKALIKKYGTLKSFLDFKSGFTQGDIDALPASKITEWATGTSIT